MEKTISLNFEIGSVKGDYYIRLFEQFVDFKPKRVSIKKKGGTWCVRNWKGAYLQDIANLSYEDVFSVSLNDVFFSVGITNSTVPHVSITIVPVNLVIDNSIFKTFIDIDGFTSAYIYNTKYTTVQDTVYSSNIEGLGYSLESIKDTPFVLDPSTGIKEYDVRCNPGRTILVGGSWIVAAWKM